MKSWMISLLLLNLALFQLSGEGKKVVLHGKIGDDCIVNLLKNNHEIKKGGLVTENLFDVDFLILGHVSDDFEEAEISAIKEAVTNGSSLIVACQAWSWSYKDYGNRENSLVPINVLGAELGFNFSKETSKTPVEFNKELLSDIKYLDLNGAVPSPIKIDHDFTWLMKDIDDRLSAGIYNFGSGKIILLSHEMFLNKSNLVNQLLTIKEKHW